MASAKLKENNESSIKLKTEKAASSAKINNQVSLHAARTSAAPAENLAIIGNRKKKKKKKKTSASKKKRKYHEKIKPKKINIENES